MSDEPNGEPRPGGGVTSLLRLIVCDPWLSPRSEQAGTKLAGGVVLLALFVWLVGPEIILRNQGELTTALITRAWVDHEVAEQHGRERLVPICLASYRFEASDGTTVTGTRKCPGELYRSAGTRVRDYRVVPNLEIDDDGEYILDPERPVLARMRYLPAKPSRNHFVGEEEYTASQTVLGGAFLLVWLSAGIGCAATGLLALNTDGVNS